jgi:hypothetical protein
MNGIDDCPQFVPFTLCKSEVIEESNQFTPFNTYTYSPVGIATSYGLDGPGSIPGSVRFFSSPQRPDRLWGPPSLLSNGYRGSFPGVKRQRREADQSPPSSAEVKKGGAIHPLPHMSSWHSTYLIKHRDSFTFNFTLRKRLVC